MKKWKLTYSIFAISAVLFTVVALCIDLNSWAESAPSGSHSWRFARTVACAFALIGVVQNPINKISKWLMPFAFALAVLADYFLILKDNLPIGIGIFALMQIVLIIRHGLGISTSALRQSGFVFSVVLSVAVILIGNALLWSSLGEKGLALPVLIYSCLLVGSTFTAYFTRFSSSFTVRASNQAFIGMLLFLLCDITVGIGAVYGEYSAGQFIRSLTGLFYTPSLLMLALSASKN